MKIILKRWAKAISVVLAAALFMTAVHNENLNALAAGLLSIANPVSGDDVSGNDVSGNTPVKRTDKTAKRRAAGGAGEHTHYLTVQLSGGDNLTYTGADLTDNIKVDIGQRIDVTSGDPAEFDGQWNYEIMKDGKKEDRIEGAGIYTVKVVPVEKEGVKYEWYGGNPEKTVTVKKAEVNLEVTCDKVYAPSLLKPTVEISAIGLDESQKDSILSALKESGNIKFYYGLDRTDNLSDTLEETEPGTYYIKAKLEGHSNFEDTESAPFSVEVLKDEKSPVVNDFTVKIDGTPLEQQGDGNYLKEIDEKTREIQISFSITENENSYEIYPVIDKVPQEKLPVTDGHFSYTISVDDWPDGAEKEITFGGSDAANNSAESFPIIKIKKDSLPPILSVGEVTGEGTPVFQSEGETGVYWTNGKDEGSIKVTLEVSGEETAPTLLVNGEDEGTEWSLAESGGKFTRTYEISKSQLTENEKGYSFVAKDNMGHLSTPPQTITLKKDADPPTVNCKVTAADGGGLFDAEGVYWVNKGAVLEFQVSDVLPVTLHEDTAEGTIVDADAQDSQKFRVQIDSTKLQEGAVKEFTYVAVDAVGNEFKKTIQLGLDTKDPEISLDKVLLSDGQSAQESAPSTGNDASKVYWTDNAVLISLKVSDAGGRKVTLHKDTKDGEAISEVEEGSGLFQIQIDSADLQEDTPKEFVFTAVDAVGNDAKAFQVKIGLDAEVVIESCNIRSQLDENEWLNGTELANGLALELTVKAAGSGVSKIAYELAGKAGEFEGIEPLNTQQELIIAREELTDGKEVPLTVKVTNALGKTAEWKLAAIAIDTLNPSQEISATFQIDDDSEPFEDKQSQLFAKQKIESIFKVSDSTSGVKDVRIRFSLNGEEQNLENLSLVETTRGETYQIFTRTFEIGEDQSITVNHIKMITIVDNAGNELTIDNPAIKEFGAELVLDNVPPVLSEITVKGNPEEPEERKSLKNSTEGENIYFQQIETVEIQIDEGYYNKKLDNKPELKLYRNGEEYQLEPAINPLDTGVTLTFPMPQETGDYYFTLGYTDNSGNPLEGGDGYTVSSSGMYTSPHLIVTALKPSETPYEQTPYIGSPREDVYYYDGAVEVDFTVEEEYSFRNLQEADFEQYIQVTLYEGTPDELSDPNHFRVNGEMVQVDGIEGRALSAASGQLTIIRSGQDILKGSFRIEGDGHYRYVVTFKGQNGKTIQKLSNVLTVDTVDPEVVFAGLTDEKGSPLAVKENASAADGYIYVDQTDGAVDQVYLKLQVTEHNFFPDLFTTARMTQFIMPAQVPSGETDLIQYLSDAEGWQIDGNNADIHYILIPLHDSLGGFGEKRYDFRAVYTDIVGQSSGDEKGIQVVYDVTPPSVDIAVKQPNVIEKILDSIFWFYQASAEITITAQDTTAGLYSLTAHSDWDVSEEIDGYQNIDFSLVYDAQENVYQLTQNGTEVPDVKMTADGGAQITIKVQPQFRGTVQASVLDRTGLETTETLQKAEESGKNVVLVVDETSPVLDELSYAAAQKVVRREDRQVVEEESAKVYNSSYWYYYNEPFEISFTISEDNFLESAGESPKEDKLFDSLKELVMISLYRADSPDAEEFQKLGDIRPTITRSGRSFTFTFTMSGYIEEEENALKEGCYYFTVSARDYSGNPIEGNRAAAGYTSNDLEAGQYTSPVLVLDNTAPQIRLSYTDSQGSVLKEGILTYQSENGKYDYFDLAKTGDVYLRVEVQEKNFLPDWLDGYDTVLTKTWLNGNAQEAALNEYLAEKAAWQQVSEDTFYTLLKLDDTAFLGEARYDLTVNYRDQAGNPAEPVTEYFVYDKTAPDVKVTYQTTTAQKVVDKLSKLFKFLNPTVTATVQVTDMTAGILYVTVRDGDVEDSIAENYDQHFSFTLSYDEQAGGVLTNADGQTIQLNVKDYVKSKDGVTTIQFNIPAQFRGIVQAAAGDKAVRTGQYDNKGQEDVVVVDTIPPVLMSVDNGNALQQVVEPDTRRTLDEAKKQAYTSAYQYYFNGDIHVTFAIKEANFFAGMGTDAKDQLFDELVKVSLLKADTVDGTYNLVTEDARELGLQVERQGSDTYVFQFTIKGDGHYKYQISARDYSNLAMTASEESTSYQGSDLAQRTEALGNETINLGVYTSPALTIDTTAPVVKVQFLDARGVSVLRGVAEHEYYNSGSMSIRLEVTEHNFRPSDVKIDMTAADVNGSGSAVESVKNANAYIGQMLEQMRDDVSSVWTPSGDIYSKTIVINSPQYDANYSFSISCTDMSNGEAGEYVYNGHSLGTQPIVKDSFTVDSTAPVMKAIDNSDESDILYRQINSGAWAKFLNFVTFGYFGREAIQVTMIAHDEISGVSTISYDAFLTGNDAVTRTGNYASGNPEATNRESKDNASRFITFTLSPDFKGDVVGSASDAAGNRCQPQSLRGIVLESSAKDQTEEHVKIDFVTEPSRTVDGIDYYNTNVNVSFAFTDTYSGLNKVGYDLANSGVYEKLYQVNGSDVTYNDVIGGVLDAAANNRNDVTVKGVYTDNAGNTGEVQRQLNVDVTAPVISVVYDLNDGLNGEYYNEPRTATVTVRERNFQESDVEFTITNTDGTMPLIGGWSHSAANGVSDETTHTCTVVFGADGDYTFTVECQDLAGNRSSYGVVDEFTVDLTDPTVEVTYDNTEALHDYYFNDYRQATISIREHNFDPAGVTVNIAATLDGEEIQAPAVLGWSRSGDVNTATVAYESDGDYTFDISFVDMAGNETEAFEQQHFVIDTVAPELEITNIQNYSANNGVVAPHVVYSDVNLDTYQIHLSGYRNGVIDVPNIVTTAEIHNGAEIALDDLEYVRANDDLYTLQAEVFDMAGNSSQEQVVYSVNRFGSVFILSDETQEYVDSFYHREEADLVVREINVNTITTTEITYSVNGEVVTLGEEDYRVDRIGEQPAWTTWKENDYTLFADNFAEEGQYAVTITSRDEAQNAMSNRTYASDEGEDALVEFVIDKTKPYSIITGVEDGEQYNEDSRTVTVDARDNILLSRVDIVLNGDTVASYDAKELSDMNGIMTQEIGSSNARQTLEVVATDMAGNVSDENVVTFLITTNLFYQYINNRGALIATAAVLGAVIVAIAGVSVARSSMAGAAAGGGSGFFFLIGKRKKKKEEEEESGGTDPK